MKELRYSQNTPEISNDSREISGYAVVFNSESRDLGGFVEIIEPNALDGVIEISDVVCLYNHNPDRGILARSTYGSGSLSLEIDNKGLRYSFSAPETQLGEEVLVSLRRKDISGSSFGFTVKEDKWEKRNDGTILRRINKIERLYDVSPVITPAYEATTVNVVDKRGYESLIKEDIVESDMNKDKLDEIRKILDELGEEVTELRNSEEPEKEEKSECEDKEKEEKSEEEKSEEERSDDNDEDKVEEKSEEEKEDDKEAKEEKEDDEKRSLPDSTITNTNIKEDKFQKININNRAMTENKFSFIRAINDVINKREFEGVNAEILNLGKEEARKAGVDVTGQILIPTNLENRADGVYAQQGNVSGGFNVAEQKLNILEPLYAQLVATKAGATMLTGLTNLVSIPTYSGSSAKWAGEIDKAENGAGEWGEVKLAPHRITTVLKISNLFLQLDNNSAEEMLKRDIVTVIGQKLESTIFGSDPSTANRPEGLMYNLTQDTADLEYSDILLMEEALEHANVYGAKHYVMSPSAKAILRGTKVDAGSGKFVMENDNISGIDCLCTSNMVSKGLILGDFSDLVIGQFGPIALTVDPVTLADEGQIRLIVNSFWDFKVRRPESFVKRILA